MADAARVLQDALALDADERARIAHELISSLEPTEADAGKTWSEEVRRRIDEVEGGTAELLPWDVVRARLEAVSRR